MVTWLGCSWTARSRKLVADSAWADVVGMPSRSGGTTSGPCGAMRATVLSLGQLSVHAPL